MTARSHARFAFAILALLVLATAAGADVPKTLDHRDPKAPSFRWPAVDLDGDGVFDRLDRCDNTPKGAIVDEWGCPLDSDGDGVYDGLDRCPDTPRGEKVDAQGCSRAQRSGSSRSAPRDVTPPPPPPPAPPPAPPVSETERQ